jgi:hypothetical protein
MNLRNPLVMPQDLFIQLAAMTFSVIDGLWRIDATRSLMVVFI